MNTPNYLVQDSSGSLHAYWSLDILLIDLHGNRATPPTAIFRRAPALGAVKFEPTTEAALRAEKAKAA